MMIKIVKYIVSYLLIAYKIRTVILYRKFSAFDSKFYLNQYPDVANQGLIPIVHYLFFGSKELRKPNPLFDPKYYSQKVFAESRREIISGALLSHYLLIGHRNGFNPNSYLDENYVKEQAESQLPGTLLYLKYGIDDKFSPSKNFNNSLYYRKRPDVKVAKVPALYHYLTSGYKEFNFFDEEELIPQKRVFIREGSSRFKLDKALLLSIYSPDGYLTELQKTQISILLKLDFDLFVVVAVDDFDNVNFDYFPDREKISNIIIRENIGYDFGSWKFVLQAFPSLGNYKELLFLNDSVIIASLSNLYSLIDFGRKTPGVSFAIENREVKSHGQSFYFHAKGKKAVQLTTEILLNSPLFNDKFELINSVEVNLAHDLQVAGLPVRYFTEASSVSQKIENLTLNRPKQLLERGFPFLKVSIFNSEEQAVLARLVSLGMNGLLSSEVIAQHVAARSGSAKKYQKPIYRHYPVERRSEYYFKNGVPLHRNPDDEIVIDIKSLILPSDYLAKKRTVVILHAYYIDNLSAIFGYLSKISDLIFLSVTTDTDAKRKAILKGLNEYSLLESEVTVYENVGRDVYPFVKELEKKLGSYDFTLHIHSKKSLHNDNLSCWLDYLLKRLIGSREIFLNNLYLMDAGELGVLFPKHYSQVNRLISWGHNITNIKRILSSDINQFNYLNFPSGTMFFARTDVLKPLTNYIKEDFGEESGQIDGSFAHAVERCILYLSANSNRGYLMVDHGNGVTFTNIKRDLSVIKCESLRMANKLLQKYIRQDNSHLAEELYHYEINQINGKPKKNLFIPTIEPAKVYGGVATALKVFKKLLAEGDAFRIVVTSDDVTREGISFITDFFGETFTLSDGESDLLSNEVIDLLNGRQLAISNGDRFMATAWWTYKLAEPAFYKVRSNNNDRICYLIQDYEPGFYEWGTKGALARSTYGNSEDFIGLINSEELAIFFENNFSLEKTWTLTYSINEKLAESIKSYLSKNEMKKKMILVYARPSVSRNLFEVIDKALDIWAQNNLEQASEFSIHLVGEDFSKDKIKNRGNWTLNGKLPLDEYAQLLAESYVGISLMESPHPSYPPLEMAYSNVKVLTNNYMNKDLSKRSGNIITVANIAPEEIADRLARTLLEFDSPTFNIPAPINHLDAQNTIGVESLNSKLLEW